MNEIEELKQKIKKQEKTVEEAYSTWPYQWYLRETDKLAKLQEQLKQLEEEKQS